MMNNELIPTPMMSFGESVKTCFQKYVTFKGRARRLLLQDTFGIPLGLPERISRIINTIFGNGV